MSAEDHTRLGQLTTNCIACLLQGGADGETMAVVGAMVIQRIALRQGRASIMVDAAMGLMAAAEFMEAESPK